MNSVRQNYSSFRPSSFLRTRPSFFCGVPKHRLTGLFQTSTQFIENGLTSRSSKTCKRLCSNKVKAEPPINSKPYLIAGTLSYKAYTALGIGSALGIGIFSYRTLFTKKKVEICSNVDDAKKKVEICSDVDSAGMKKIIFELVNQKEKEGIKKLINLLRDPEKNFPKIESWYLWEIEILDALIESEDLEMIREIFPLFRQQTLSYNNRFYKIIREDKFDLLKAMIDGGMNPLNEYLTDYTDMFLYSLYLHRFQIFHYFLELKKIDINKAYPVSIHYIERGNWVPNGHHQDCITPAYFAVLMNDPELLKQLIDLGANINLPNERPTNAGNRSSEHDSESPVFLSIHKGFEDCFKILIDTKNFDLNFRGKLLKTPLMAATFDKKSTMAQALIAKGADVNIPGFFNITPIMLSVGSGDIPTINALIKAGANVRCIDEHGRNLWHFAVKSKSEEVFNLLRQLGIQDMINDETQIGDTPLCDAIESANPLVVTSLLVSGADINKKLDKLGSCTRELLKLPMSGQVTIQELASARLKKHERDFEKHPQDAEYYNKSIPALKEIIEILKNPPKLEKIKVKHTPAALRPKINVELN